MIILFPFGTILPDACWKRVPAGEPRRAARWESGLASGKLLLATAQPSSVPVVQLVLSGPLKGCKVHLKALLGSGAGERP